MLLDKITKHMSARPDALLLHYLCNSMQTWVSILSQFHKARHHIDPSVLRSSDVYKMRSRVGEHKTDVQGKAEPSSRSQTLTLTVVSGGSRWLFAKFSERLRYSVRENLRVIYPSCCDFLFSGRSIQPSNWTSQRSWTVSLKLWVPIPRHRTFKAASVSVLRHKIIRSELKTLIYFKEEPTPSVDSRSSRWFCDAAHDCDNTGRSGCG